MNIADERRNTYQKMTASQNEVKELNVSINELELNLEKSSDGMKSKYQDVLKGKQSELAQASMTLDQHYKRLTLLNTPEGEAEFLGESIPENFPHSHVSRASLSEEDRISIFKQYGKQAYMSMPA